MKKNTKLILKILASVFLMAGALFAGLILLVMISFGSINQNFHGWMILPGEIGILLFLLAWILWKRWLAWIGAAILAAAVLCSAGKEIHYWQTQGRYEVVKGDMNEWDYRPFRDGNKLVTLTPLPHKLIGDLPRIDGATALFPVYAAAVQAIYPKDPKDYYRDTVQKNGSDVIFGRLLKGEVDMIFALAPSAEQLADAEAAGLTYEMTPLGRDAFVFYVNAKNPVSNLTRNDIRGIYSGKITNWKEVGAPKRAKIVPFQRNKNSGSQTTLEKIMGDTPIMPPLEEDELEGMGGIIRRTANYRNSNEALGFSFRFYATEMVRNDKIKLLSIDGIAPTPENIANGTYPYIATAYVITVKERTGNVQKFIDFMLSPQGREIIEKTGYVFYTDK